MLSARELRDGKRSVSFCTEHTFMTMMLNPAEASAAIKTKSFPVMPVAMIELDQDVQQS